MRQFILYLEPQAQLVRQRMWLDRRQDRFSSVVFDSSSAVLGRLGLRLEATLATQAGQWQPYLQANLWREFGGRDNITFAGTDTVAARRGTTALELGLGIAARMSPRLHLYAGGSYTTNLGGQDLRSFSGQRRPAFHLVGAAIRTATSSVAPRLCTMIAIGRVSGETPGPQACRQWAFSRAQQLADAILKLADSFLRQRLLRAAGAAQQTRPAPSGSTQAVERAVRNQGALFARNG